MILNPDDVVSLVSSIWERVLEIKQIDIYKNFTQLGGDSIIATYLVKEMEKQFGNIIDITDIFAYTSVSENASHIINIIEETKVVKNNEKEDSITQSDDDSQENEIRQIDEDAYLDELITKLVEEKDNLENADDILSGGNSGIWKE